MSLPTPWICEAAHADERRAALELFFQRLPDRPRQMRVDEVLGWIDEEKFPAEGLRTVRDPAGALVGVFPCQLLPGFNGQVWAPVVNAAGAAETLIRDGLDWLRGQNARFAHLLLPPEDSARAEILLPFGFDYVSKISLWQHSLRGIHAAPLPAGVALETWRLGNDKRFARTMEATFAETLDIPEMNGQRTGAELLACHRVEGVFRPHCWHLATCGGKDVGLALVNEKPDGWELSYLGVIPSWRGRGVGRALLSAALQSARAREAPQLYVSVDVRNDPALQLYREGGFFPRETHDIYLAFFK